MMSKIKHRGPDDEGIFVNDNLGIGFVRLSILDLSMNGHQPMFDKSKRYAITHNGEVYNYLEIREELIAKGYTFSSDTDTEVILYAYLEWGEDCLNKFNGMWSFGIFDFKESKVFFSRDRYGIKPFYFYRDKEKLIYASEIQAILEVLPKDRINTNENELFDYIVFNRTDQSDRTFFKGIKKMLHGHSMSIENNRLDIKRWYQLRDNISNPFKDEEEYLETLTSSVDIRLRSDVPVGLSLSGGIDSSSIASILINKLDYQDINTFSAVYGEGVTGDESDFINLYSDQLKNMHFTTPTSETLLADMEKYIQVHTEPVFRTGPYVQYKVMELAKEHCIVTLDGQGADEQLGGYHYFFGFLFKDLIRRLKLVNFLKESSSYYMNHKSLDGFYSLAFLFLPKKLQSTAKTLTRNNINQEFMNEFKNESITTELLYSSESLKEALLNHFEMKLEHLLKWNDKNSMWFGLESRVPFLDYRLVERTLSLDNNQIIKNGTTKHILRESMVGIMPESIRMRKDKVGFGNPEDEWYREPLFVEYINDLIDSSSFKALGYFDVAKTKKLYKKHLDRKINISKEIWKWINITKSLN